jgi:hypothetical protein
MGGGEEGEGGGGRGEIDTWISLWISIKSYIANIDTVYFHWILKFT